MSSISEEKEKIKPVFETWFKAEGFSVSLTEQLRFPLGQNLVEDVVISFSLQLISDPRFLQQIWHKKTICLFQMLCQSQKAQQCLFHTYMFQCRQKTVFHWHQSGFEWIYPTIKTDEDPLFTNPFEMIVKLVCPICFSCFWFKIIFSLLRHWCFTGENLVSMFDQKYLTDKIRHIENSQIGKNCHSWWSLHSQKPPEQGWLGWFDLPEFPESVMDE